MRVGKQYTGGNRNWLIAILVISMVMVMTYLIRRFKFLPKEELADIKDLAENQELPVRIMG